MAKQAKFVIDADFGQIEELTYFKLLAQQKRTQEYLARFPEVTVIHDSIFVPQGSEFSVGEYMQAALGSAEISTATGRNTDPTAALWDNFNKILGPTRG